MYRNIQALRAVAALAVAYYHLSQFNAAIPMLGTFGVDLFFVISGFIMAHTTSRGERHFLVKRLTRIAPLYWLMTALICAVAALAPHFLASTTVDAANFLKSILFIPYRKESGLIQPMLFLGWTLNYEMYFYLAISLSLWLASGLTAALAAAGAIAAASLALGASSCTVAACEFYADPIVLEFLFGVLAYAALAWVDRLGRPARIVAASLLGLTSAIAILWDNWAFSITDRHLLLGLPAAGLVLAAAALDRAGAGLRWRAVLLVGDASYVLYLTHPYVEHAFMLAARRLPVLDPTTGLPGLVASGLLVTAVAVLGHLQVELPLLRATRASLLRLLSPEQARRA